MLLADDAGMTDQGMLRIENGVFDRYLSGHGNPVDCVVLYRDPPEEEYVLVLELRFASGATKVVELKVPEALLPTTNGWVSVDLPAADLGRELGRLRVSVSIKGDPAPAVWTEVEVVP